MRTLLKFLYNIYPIRKGRGRLFEFVRRRLTGRILCRVPSGDLLLLDLDNLLDCMTFLDGGYESEDVECLAQAGHKFSCDCFLDIGANIGTYSLHFAKNPRFSRLFAFEPDPRNYAQLSANLWLNNLIGRIQLFSKALAAESGSVTFYVNKPERVPGGPQFNTGTSSLVRENSPHHRPISVQAARLDDVVTLCGCRALVKIDVEGAEEGVLMGARNFLASNQCVVMIEIWSHPPGRFESIDKILRQCGYQKQPAGLSQENHLYVSERLLDAAPCAAAVLPPQ